MSPEIPKRHLAEVLLEQHVVTEEELKECREIARASNTGLVNVLIGKGYVDEEDLVVAFCEHFRFTHIRLDRYKVDEKNIALVPEHLARRYEVLPISTTQYALTLAMVDPLQLTAIDMIRNLAGLEIEPLVAVRSELLAAIDKNYGGWSEDDDESGEDGDLGAVEEIEIADNVEDVTVERADAEEEPVVRLVRRILREAVRTGSSDIHVEPFEKVISLRYRIDGTLEDFKRPPKRLQSQMTARFKILSGCRIDEHRLPQDGRLRIRYEGRDIDFRVAFLPCHYGEKVVLRILDKGSLALDLDKMGFEAQPMEAFRHALALPNGMVLMTGPTGSGKTTTLYSALHRLNTRARNIVTVEDPIEYELFGINQVQTHASIGLTFAEALRQILRQDPDIVMVGEIRDGKTADVAVKAALTGHLVLSTLHTNDAAGVFPRLIDMEVEPFLVQSSVVLAAAQRLLKRVCNECKQEVRVAGDVLERLHYSPLPDDPEPHFVQGRGCAQCKDSGFKGRVAVIEAMPNWPEISKLVLGKASGTQIKRRAMACGMRTLRQNALASAAKGVTTIPQVLEHTMEDLVQN